MSNLVLYPIIEKTLLDATIHRNNFSSIASIYNEHDRNKTLVHGLEGVNEVSSVSYYTNILEKHNPIGTVIEVWDNEIVAVKELIDSDIYTELDGKTINDEASLFNGITIPDSAEVYIMSVKQSDVLEADVYSSNTIDLSHSHTYAHNHVLGAHTHTIANHTHTNQSLSVCLWYSSANDRLYFRHSTVAWTSEERGGNFSYTASSTQISYGVSIEGTNSSTGSGTSDVAEGLSTTSTDTISYDTQLSATQDIRPYSIKCRRYLRYK